MTAEEIFNRHARAMLMYSGGKDSLACLLTLRPYWDRLEVVWVDTGNQFPEVVEHMKTVRALVPHFTVLHGNTPAFFAVHGAPVDVVPTRYSAMGQYIYGPTTIKVCNRFDCCGANIWKPMADYIALTRPTCVIRGDRSSERVKGLTEAEGVEYAFPIFDWTTEQVMEVVRNAPDVLYQERHELPEGSSLDCMTCTAYWCEHPSRMKYLKAKYPELYEATEAFFQKYKAAVAAEMLKLED